MKRAARAGLFLKSFPWMSFLLQGAQVTADLFGRGLQLGSVMGFVSDSMYGAFRWATGSPVVFRGPPPSDALGKAYRYIAQPAYHYRYGQLFTPEEHWLLLAADAIALRAVMAHHSPDQVAPRIPSILAAAPPVQEPWHPATVELLRMKGWTAETGYRPPIPGLSPTANHGEVLTEMAEALGDWLQEIRRDMPRSHSTTAFAMALGQLNEDVLDWWTGAPGTLEHIFTPEEYTLARCFEFNIFPPAGADRGLIERFIERALDLARAFGKTLPGALELKTAANEIWGRYDTQ